MKAEQPTSPQPAGALPEVLVVGAYPSEIRVRKREPGHGWIAAGVVLSTIGYGLALISAAVGTAVASSDQSEHGATCAGSAPLAFIPLVGPFLTLAEYPGHQVTTYGSQGPYVLDCDRARGGLAALVLTDEALQLGGAAMLALGISIRIRAHRTPRSAGFLLPQSVYIVPGTAGAPLGLSVRAVSF